MRVAIDASCHFADSASPTMRSLGAPEKRSVVRMPVEVWERIFRLLDAEDIVRVRSVCTVTDM